MPNPREAIYDVLMAKKQRRELEQKQQDLYDEWNQENQLARSAAELRAKR